VVEQTAGKNTESSSARCQVLKSTTRKFHHSPPITTKLHHPHLHPKGTATTAFGKSCHRRGHLKSSPTDPKETFTCAGVIVCCGSVRDAHNRNYITYIGNKLQLVRKGDDNTSLHSPLPADETLYMRQPVRQGDDNTSLHSPLAVDETPYMRQPVRQGDDNTIQGFVLKQRKHNLHLQHKAIYQRKL
jgi:hypothetical protein